MTAVYRLPSKMGGEMSTTSAMAPGSVASDNSLQDAVDVFR